jgi:hypothetical protein
MGTRRQKVEAKRRLLKRVEFIFGAGLKVVRAS